MQQGKDLRAGRNHWTAARKASGASGVLGDGPVLNRRSMMKALGLGAAGIAVPGLVAGCSSSSGGATRIVFEETKPEVVPYFNNLVAKFNASQSKVVVTHDFTSSLIAEFVRGNPPAIDCDNYNLTTSIFVARGVLADLAQPAAGQDHRPEHPGSGHPVRLVPGRDERAALLGGRRGRHLQPGPVRQGRRVRRPDHLDRIRRGVREVQVQGHRADLPDLRGYLDHAAGPVRLHGGRHGRRRGVLPGARSRGHQPRSQLVGVVREGFHRALQADAQPGTVFQREPDRQALRRRQPRLRQRPGRHVHAGAVGRRRGPRDQSQAQAGHLPPARHRRRVPDQVPGQPRPGRLAAAIATGPRSARRPSSSSTTSCNRAS